MMRLTGKRLERKGYLDGKEVERIASRMRIPSSRVYGFASQFEEFPLRPHKARLRVCTGPACAEAGGWAILEDLERRAPEDILVSGEAGILRWHGSPAVCIEIPGEGRWLAEELTPADTDALMASLENKELSSFKPLPEAEPPSPACLPGGDPSPWTLAAAAGTLPDTWGPELLGRVSDDPSEVASMLAESGAPAYAWGGEAKKPRVLVCDAVGREAENSVAFTAFLLHPRAVVAGAAIAAAASGARELVFYTPWNEPEAGEALEETAGELLSGVGVRYSIFAGPAHVPCSLDIGRAALLRGMMLWKAASLYGWSGTLESDLPVAVLSAELAWRLPWIEENEGDARQGWQASRLLCLNGIDARPQLLEATLGTAFADVLDGVGVKSADGFKAVHLAGAANGDILSRWDKAGSVEGGVEALMLDTLDCIPRWALYLARHAERDCCGGCTPGRTAPAAVARLLQMVLKGEADGDEMRRLRALLDTSGKLALCPHLEETLTSIASCLSEFEDEFEAHAADGSCRAGSCAPAVEAAT
jgi:hypothetical protein